MRQPGLSQNPDSGETPLPLWSRAEGEVADGFDGILAGMGAVRLTCDRLTPTVSGGLSSSGSAELVFDEAHFARVVEQGVLCAKTSIDIATADFKAMLVPVGKGRRAKSIVEHLRKLATDGVEIRLLHAGTPSSAALQELKKALPRGLTIRRCPRLHAKAVVIDCRAMYLGSANLTGAGLGAKAKDKRNIEWGVWTESGTMIDSVLEQFNALWEGRRCKTCRRKNVCPVPLEEPAL